MNVDISGKIVAVLEPVGGTSKSTGNPWKAQSYVIETKEQFPKKVCFEVFGEDRINQFAIKEGDEYIVSCDIESHEYMGRWYTRLRAWRVQQDTQAMMPPFNGPQQPATPPTTQGAAGPQTAQFDSAAGDSEGDLPF
ncbi:MAG: DUF3127 domain-containing protein [Paludibacteraceae bacterium]|nr:DUF3127 domain-containing protein [Paludibacteraceae bacterium]